MVPKPPFGARNPVPPRRPQAPLSESPYVRAVEAIAAERRAELTTARNRGRVQGGVAVALLWLAVLGLLEMGVL